MLLLLTIVLNFSYALFDYTFSDDYPVSGAVRICFFCDAKCYQALKSDNLTVHEFFFNITSSTNRIFEASQIPISLQHHGTRVSSKNISLEFLQTGATLSQKIQAINDEFWSSRFKAMKKKGCDASFLVTEDEVWEKEGVGGASSQAALCTSRSHGLMRLFPQDSGKMAARLAHELGHLLGMEHYDQPVDPVYLEARYDKHNAEIKRHCTDHPLCKDVSGMCIMVSSLNRPPYPSLFSDCAKSFLKFWMSFPAAYNHSCVIGQ